MSRNVSIARSAMGWNESASFSKQVKVTVSWASPSFTL